MSTSAASSINQNKQLKKPPLSQRLTESPVLSCIAGSVILWATFGIRQSVGVFLIPVTSETGWDRSTFSIAAALYQLLWGFSQPFIVYLAERKVGFGKSIFMSCMLYAVGCFILYASDRSAGLFIFAMGVVMGVSGGGSSYPSILASVGRRFPQKSKQQGIAFGIVSSFGSFGQSCFLPVVRVMLTSIGWRLSFVAMGLVMLAVTPLAYMLQTVPPIPALPEEKYVKSSGIYDEEVRHNKSEFNAKTKSIQPLSEQEEINCRPLEDISAPDIDTALREALTNPTFIFITVGFTVCGFHVGFITTHFPAYLQDNGIDPSLAAWTVSIFGICSMIGTMISGYLSTILSPKYILMGIYGLRAVLIVVVVFIPMSVTMVVVFSIFFGFLWLSTVPPTTKFVGDVFGHKYLGTLTAITYVGHQIGAFLGAYIAGVIYDQIHDYRRMWYGSLAVAILAVLANFMAGAEPINEIILRRQELLDEDTEQFESSKSRD